MNAVTTYNITTYSAAVMAILFLLVAVWCQFPNQNGVVILSIATVPTTDMLIVTLPIFLTDNTPRTLYIHPGWSF